MTYRVSKYPESSKLTKKQVDKEIKEAFNLWSNVTDLSFTDRSYGPVHIDIRFEKRFDLKISQKNCRIFAKVYISSILIKCVQKSLIKLAWQIMLIIC